MRRRAVLALGVISLALIVFAPSAHAAQALVAVTTSFSRLAGELVRRFEADTGHTVELASGSTGKLYAQIVNGAPFDALLAADQERPRRLEAEGLSVPGSRQVYAVGQLSLWQADGPSLGNDAVSVLRSKKFRTLAMANPRLAPYGAAALQTLQALDLSEALADRIVMGENIAQAYALVASGNASVGFIATAQLAGSPGRGNSWPVSPELYQPIRQELVLLPRGAENPAAREFIEYLLGPAGRKRIAAAGFGLE